MHIKKTAVWIAAALFTVMPLVSYGETITAALWSRPYIVPMEAAGLIPPSLKADTSYRDAITREEFAELMISYLNQADSDRVDSDEKEHPFTDTENPSAAAAYHLGIIAGVTPTLFAPDLPLSRAEAATMIYRMEALLSPAEPGNAVSRSFKDQSAIPEWARLAVASTVDAGIFSGYEDGTFQPETKLTEEQGIKLLAVLAEKRALIAIDTAAYPPVKFGFSETTVSQGDLITFTVQGSRPGDVPFMTQTLHQDFRFFTDAEGFTGTIPTGYATPPGTYWLEYGIQGFAPEVQLITVLPRAFRVQELRVSKAISDSTRTEAANKEYALYFKPVRKISSPEKYYTEDFVLPVSGRLSTEFGEMRRVNNALTSYRHSGLDIAAPQGTPVLATNRGKVVLSMNLILTGNTIVIDHGQGLFSVYFHMSELLTPKNVVVERGAIIGKVGSTGFSTGAHLHFTMSYYETNVEPGHLIYGKAVTKVNYKGLFE